ncbi:acyclic terpene utilization AtuA family protein [Micromonospora inositola]|uniref:acyclic terpene utilization AtuA family protein n=1 Tax=Micromonospora inositola TaxID=47865 RepID=UPI000B5ADAB9|nr:acyclic terpene utilization AtuA family protein [Micromonospora inositola]
MIRIANCSGYFGDRPTAALEMVEGGHIDVLTGDWLAELTMYILSKTRAKNPSAGYARTFVRQVEQVMAACLDRGIKIVANAGGLDPAGCASAVRDVADLLGLSPRIAYVEGDDVSSRIAALSAAGALTELVTGAPAAELNDCVVANAYLGGWGITSALKEGADIVVTGRVVDAALVTGPAAWFHEWEPDDWDALAGATAAGHVIECGTQATGGNYSFFDEDLLAGPVGFPWAEVAADGTSVIGKHDGTWGQVNVETVTSQLLYEVGSPRYLSPDVVTRLDSLVLRQLDDGRVEISGARGEPAPTTLKVGVVQDGGYRQDVTIALTGLDIEAKARVVERAFWNACVHDRGDFDSVEVKLHRTDKVDPSSNEEAVATWQMTIRHRDDAKLGRSIFDARAQLGLATIPGFFSLGGERSVTRVGVFRPLLLEATHVATTVTEVGGATWSVPDLVTRHRVPVEQDHANGMDTVPSPVSGECETAPLGRLVGARSGDKGGDANLGVYARSDVAYEWLVHFLTVDRLRELLPEAKELAIERYRMPNLRALNFVLRGLLGEGVAASSRQDPQAKSLAEWLRSRLVDVPAHLLADAHTRPAVTTSDHS